MTKAILQNRLPFLPWMDSRTNRLPGILPVEGEDWLRIDEAYAGQMARRDALFAQCPEKVHALLPQARPAAQELYALTLDWLKTQEGFAWKEASVLRPDGVEVSLDAENPLLTLGRLVQEDLCIMEHDGTESVLTGAALCFPASWTLGQKIGKRMLAIHVPVPEFDERVSKGVQRLFDAIRPEQMLWRMNYLTYDDPELHQPRLEGESRPRPKDHVFVRCERQVLRRLPQSRAVIFSIHTYVVTADTLTSDERERLFAVTH